MRKLFLLFAALLFFSVTPSLAQINATANLTASAASCPTTGPGATTSSLVVAVKNNQGGYGINLSGTWSGTVSFFGATNGQGGWSALAATALSGGSAVTTATANGNWQVNSAGLQGICAVVTTYASGTVTVAISASTASARSGGSGGGGGSGTVTSVSGDGTVECGTVTTSGSFSACNAAQNSALAGPVSGGAGAPSYQTAPTISAANMTSFPTFNQNTTGTAAGLTGCTTSTAGSICYWNGTAWTVLAGNTTTTNWLQETSAGVPSWTTPTGGGNTTSTSLTTNTIPKANGANSIINSTLSDNGTTVSTTEPISGLGFTATGTGAGFLALTQGADNCASNQPANSMCVEAPATVGTAYHRVFAGTPSTGIPHFSYSSPTITETISGIAIADLTATGTPSSSTFLRGDNTWAAPSGSGTVTSVGQSMPSQFAVANSPVTTSATLADTWANPNTAQNIDPFAPFFGWPNARVTRRVLPQVTGVWDHAGEGVSEVGTGISSNLSAATSSAPFMGGESTGGTIDTPAGLSGDSTGTTTGDGTLHRTGRTHGIMGQTAGSLSTTTSIRMFRGYTSLTIAGQVQPGGGAGSDVPTGNYVGIMFSTTGTYTGLTDTTHFVCVAMNGTTQKAVSSGVSADANFHYFAFWEDITNSEWHYYIDNAEVCSGISTDIPASGTNLAYQESVMNLAASSVALNTAWVVSQDDK